MSYYKNALKLRPFIEKAIQFLSDEDALEAQALYPDWESGVHYAANTARVKYDGVLYKCRQAHTAQIGWEPDNAPALWAAVSIEEGTQVKPITAVRGMEYEEGKYYLDADDGGIYLCIRSGVLHYLPHELVGQYFEEVM